MHVTPKFAYSSKNDFTLSLKDIKYLLTRCFSLPA